MPESLDEARKAFAEIATIGLKAKYGEATGGAYAFLVFGGYGVPGLISDAELAVAASLDGNPSAVADRFTSDAAASLATDVLSKVLEKALIAAGIEVTTFGSIALSFFSAFLRPTALGDATLPQTPSPLPEPPAPPPKAKPEFKEPKEPKNDWKEPKEPKEPKEVSPPEPKEPKEPKISLPKG